MEGCVAATTLWARVYFVLFYGFSVLCVLSVLVRFERRCLLFVYWYVDSFRWLAQLAFLLEAFAIKREYNQKVMQVRKVRKADGHVAANQLEQQVLGEPWCVALMCRVAVASPVSRSTRHPPQGKPPSPLGYRLHSVDAVQTIPPQ